MGHKIVEAILEDGQLKYVNTKLPNGRLKVHLIYDVVEETPLEIEGSRMVRETSGIYKDIDTDDESRKLREEWDRNVCNWVSNRH